LADIQNAFRTAVAQTAEGNENLEQALEVVEDGDFTFEDVDLDGEDEDMESFNAIEDEEPKA